MVAGSGFAMTTSTTAETFIRLTSVATALVLGGKGAMLRAVTGILTTTWSTTPASTSTDRRTKLDDAAARDWADAAMRGAEVEATVVEGWVVTDCVVADCVVADCAAAGSVEGIPPVVFGGGFAEVLAACELPEPFGKIVAGTTADGSVVTEIVSEPMVFTVVVVRRGLGTAVALAAGFVTAGGDEAITNDVRRGPSWVVGAVDRR